MSSMESLANTISAAVIAGVKKAVDTNDNLNNDSTTSDTNNNDPNKRSASSGRVGEFMSKRRRGTSQQQT